MKQQYNKNWRSELRKDSKRSSKSKGQSVKLEVIRSEDLPELITQSEAADLLRVHYKTIEEYRKDGRLRFVKKGGRYYTTAAWIAEHLENECVVA